MHKEHWDRALGVAERLPELPSGNYSGRIQGSFRHLKKVRGDASGDLRSDEDNEEGGGRENPRRKIGAAAAEMKERI